MSEAEQLPSIVRIQRDGTFNKFVDRDYSSNAFTTAILNSKDRDNQEMDIDMCLKMLSMYLETIDSDLRDVVIQNQDKLFDQIGDIKELKTEYGTVGSKVKEITDSFNSIKEEVTGSCKYINENSVRLQNFNTVVAVLRQISSFRSGVKKIRNFLADDVPTMRAWLRAQKALQEIDKVYIEGRLESIKCLVDDVKYYQDIRIKIVDHVTNKEYSYLFNYTWELYSYKWSKDVLIRPSFSCSYAFPAIHSMIRDKLIVYNESTSNRDSSFGNSFIVL